MVENHQISHFGVAYVNLSVKIPILKSVTAAAAAVILSAKVSSSYPPSTSFFSVVFPNESFPVLVPVTSFVSKVIRRIIEPTDNFNTV